MWSVMGDSHGEFKWFKKAANLSHNVIVLGDAGLNNYVWYDKTSGKYKEMDYAVQLKERIKTELPNTTFFCIHGNHEARPQTVFGYHEIDFCGGKVMIQDEYPNLIFAIDGEVYELDGKKYIVIGGAYSVDKWERLKRSLQDPNCNWFADEQPDDAIKQKVEMKLNAYNWRIHGILSHTCPYKYIPRELFLSGFDQRLVDNSTEKWLDQIEENLNYDIWYFGHYHGYKHIDKMMLLFHEVVELE